MPNADDEFEPWLGCLLLAFLPLAVSVFLSREFVPYCLLASGLLIVGGIGMLVRQEVRKRSRDVGDP